MSNTDVRSDGRKFDELRPTKITRNYLKYPEGSVLIEQGDTKVIVTASVSDQVARWMKDTDNSWITAEYSMLPRANDKRTSRERDNTPGRSIEIQRLVGRALRAGFNLQNIGECMITVDCDVIQGDGGTRCASITGGFVAVYDAFKWTLDHGIIRKFPEYKHVAAISVGVMNGKPLLDLKYSEDSNIGVDINFVMNEDLEILEIQGTSEKEPLTKGLLFDIIPIAEKGIKELIAYQKQVLNLNL